MADRRPTIPAALKRQVLDEFNHRCAICGKERPQVHHIDGDRGNNVPSNLLPLCPNHHLIDQHNPTAELHPKKLGLFRKFKDPFILDPRFEPLFSRTCFLDAIDDTIDVRLLEERCSELTFFVAALSMGQFYADRLGILSKRKRYVDFVDDGYPARVRKREQEYRVQIREARDRIMTLIVELLRYQGWSSREPT